MPQYKLHYFDGRGRGEGCRLIFAAAGVDYEDIRIDEDNEWPAEKSTGKYVFGQVPCLDVDDVRITQSRAIARYLATQFGMMGSSAMDNAKIDMIADTMEDLFEGWAQFIFKIEDEQKKAEAKDVYETSTVPTVLGALEKILKDNNGGKGYLVGPKLTWADLFFFAQMDTNLQLNPKVLDDYPALKALYKRVGDLPKVAAWVQKRPKTDW
ncbi:hematopoietic prostaglandin D synthase-like [Ptychodera flava]|uniref:hematopoietic prostaglandin D synthase-like n=1 Tax=Ptychodera flava TaxID=63121 RepID=UPI00396A337E